MRRDWLFITKLPFFIGVHPHDAKSMVEEDLWASLKSIAMAPECVAIGECGLDYGKDFSEPAVQRDIFTKQVPYYDLLIIVRI